MNNKIPKNIRNYFLTYLFRNVFEGRFCVVVKIRGSVFGIVRFVREPIAHGLWNKTSCKERKESTSGKYLPRMCF